MRECLRVTWTVTPLRPPVAWRHCSHCSQTRRFRTSEKFRVNAQKKRIDVWLIYRCEICAASWNLPIIERAMVSATDPSALSGFMRNDEGLARRYAFDLEGVRRHGVRVEACSEFVVGKTYVVGCRRDPDAIEVTLHMRGHCEVRLDQLLAREFGLSRGSIARLADQDVLTVIPVSRKGVRTMLADGQVIRVDGEPAARLTGAALEGVSQVSP
jgi:hypothetical protein